VILADVVRDGIDEVVVVVTSVVAGPAVDEEVDELEGLELEDDDKLEEGVLEESELESDDELEDDVELEDDDELEEDDELEDDGELEDDEELEVVVVLVVVVVIVVDEDNAASLLYMFSLPEPPQYSSGFPLQTMVHPELVGTLPAFTVFPQKPKTKVSIFADHHSVRDVHSRAYSTPNHVKLPQ